MLPANALFMKWAAGFGYKTHRTSLRKNLVSRFDRVRRKFACPMTWVSIDMSWDFGKLKQTILQNVPDEQHKNNATHIHNKRDRSTHTLITTE